MRKKTVIIELNFYEDGTEDADVKTDSVPKTLIIEKLNTLSKGLAQQVVKDAGFVPGNQQEDYLNARISIDREILKGLFNS